MPLDLALCTTLVKAIGLGRTLWKVGGTADFDSVASALEKVVDVSGTALAGGKLSKSLAARHCALVVAAFGEAYRGYWCGDENFAPRVGILASMTDDTRGRRRRKQLEEHTLAAATRLVQPGLLPPQEDLNLVASLLTDPLQTPYYKGLYESFADTKIDKPDDEPLLMPDRRLEFERGFRLAYAEGLCSQHGEEIRRYLVALEQDRTGIVRELLTRDIATWGSVNVFGGGMQVNGLAPMPLDEFYIEPFVTCKKTATGQFLEAIEQALEDHLVVVVEADFGHGKSLSARMLALTQARKFLSSETPSPDLWRPVFIKCSEDFKSHAEGIESVIRSAQWRHARQIGLELAMKDPVFNAPPSQARTLFLIDGFDEVAFAPDELLRFFDRLHEASSDRHRFVVFSRPSAVPKSERVLEGVPILELQPFTAVGADGSTGGQVEEWLARWSRVSKRSPPLSVADLEARAVIDVARTPILLFMIAFSWDTQTASGAGLASIYESFFQQVARGKYELDADEHSPIARASERLAERLVEKRLLQRGATPPDAMLWLMGRIAWEVQCLSRPAIISPEWHEQSLDRHHVRSILRRELGVGDDPQMEQTMLTGVLLALQADLSSGEPKILFGHKSFLEFLVARYWATRLQELTRTDTERRWEFQAEEPLLLGELVLHPRSDDQSAPFLFEMLEQVSPDVKHQLLDWATRCFNDARFGRADELRDDRRPLLRQAALAIGSSLAGEQGVEMKDPDALRSIFAWNVCVGRELRVYAPFIRAKNANLRGLKGFDLDLHAADLSFASMSHAHLGGCDMRGAVLIMANATYTRFSRCDLRGAQLQSARMLGARFLAADLRGADLRGAILVTADLYGADLRGADLRGADLRGADLNGAKLDDNALSVARTGPFSARDYRTLPTFGPEVELQPDTRARAAKAAAKFGPKQGTPGSRKKMSRARR